MQVEREQILNPEILGKTTLPYITEALPGTGGTLKSMAADFVVEELPLYDLAGEGEHIYLRVMREGWTTRRLQTRLAQLFGLPEWSVGFAGLKDRHARATQYFSLHLPNAAEETVGRRVKQELGVTVESVRRHRNKLRTGHLRGNRFRILLRQPRENALDRARSIAGILQQRGLPNYYGSQRFGAKGDNALLGLGVLHGRRPRQRRQRRFLLSALQSALFNAWLARRIARGWFETIQAGDVACRLASGGLFVVEDVERESARLAQREIAVTGPIFGKDMLAARHEPGEMEQALLEAAGITEQMLTRTRLQGTRRVARLFIDDLRIEEVPEGLWFTFTLPPGAYATTVLREFMKSAEKPHQD